MTSVRKLSRTLGGYWASRSRRSSDDDGVRAAFAAALAVIFLLVAGVGGWAVAWPLASAVIAQGTVVVASNVKKVQHPTGGVIAEIAVRDGDQVREGDLLILLDETVTRANLQIIEKQLDGLAVRLARLAAERDDAKTMTMPQALLQRKDEPEVVALIEAERSLFESRRRARNGQKAQLRERMAQLEEEIGGYRAQEQAKAQEIALIRVELEGLRQLWGQKLVSLAKMTQYQRDEARLVGERAQLIATTAQARGKIAELDLQIVQIDRDLHAEIMVDLREAQGKEAELVEKRVAARDTLKRVSIRAPQSGIVHQLAVHTVGGVIMPGEQLMLIVPVSDALAVEAKVASRDIDQVRLGQPVFVRFTAFDQRTTPEFAGTVAHVSPDIAKDKEAPTGSSFYTVRVKPTADDLREATGLRLVPGMPAEVHIIAGERTAVTYLLKPLRDQFARAFTER